jgi:hypothetical protein
MHRRPDRKLAAFTAALAVLPMLGGCVQATRHSNTMVFGTNTSLGVKVGTATGQVPAILVGYDRQEAVIMPLVANTTDHSRGITKSDGSKIYTNRLGPCDLNADIKVQVQQQAGTNLATVRPIHPCLLVSTNGASTDAYSVLASFGANISGTAGTENEAAVGLAQYFSTGLAAQLLAATGGASVVNISSKPLAPGSGAATANALFATPDQRQAAAVQIVAYDKLQAEFTDHLNGLNDTDATAFLSRFGTASKLPGFSSYCPDKKTCLAAVGAGIFSGYDDQEALYTAFDAAKKGS